MFDTKLKLRYLLSDLTEKSGSVRLNEHEHNKLTLILVDPVDDEDWRDRPRTDPSSVSDSGTGWIQLNFRVETLCVQLRDSQFQLDQLIETPFTSGPDFLSGIVSSIVSYRASYLDLYLLNKNLNKVRD